MCVSFKGPLARKDSVVVLRDASTISTLWQCDRFIKMAVPAFMTSIIKANPIVFLSEILNILQPAIGRQTDPCVIDSQDNCAASSARKAYNLSLIYIYFLPLNAADTVLGGYSRAPDCHYSTIKL